MSGFFVSTCVNRASQIYQACRKTPNTKPKPNMSNMSYCRFNNTRIDLQDCVDAWHEGVSSKDEARARKALIEVAEEIIELAKQDSEMVANLELNEEGDDDSE